MTKNSKKELEGKASKLLEARENAGEQGAIGFSFEADWSRTWCKFFFGPIRERSKAKLEQSWVIFDTVENYSLTCVGPM